MTTAACEACGEQNPPGTQFCLRCNSFLAWEEPATGDSHSGDPHPGADSAAATGGADRDPGDAEDQTRRAGRPGRAD